jgi:hypothetical protein
VRNTGRVRTVSRGKKSGITVARVEWFSTLSTNMSLLVQAASLPSPRDPGAVQLATSLEDWLRPSIVDQRTLAVVRWLDGIATNAHSMNFAHRREAAMVWLALAHALSDKGDRVRVRYVVAG